MLTDGLPDECWESQPFEVLPSPSRRLSYSPQMPPPGGLMSPRLIGKIDGAPASVPVISS